MIPDDTELDLTPSFPDCGSGRDDGGLPARRLPGRLSAATAAHADEQRSTTSWRRALAIATGTAYELVPSTQCNLTCKIFSSHCFKSSRPTPR